MKNIESIVKDGCILTIGNFDGVHLGHQEILKETVSQARQSGLPALAMTFDPHPAVVLGYGAPPQLTASGRKVELMQSFGIRKCIIQPFTDELSRLSARQFVQDLLMNPLHVRRLVIGPTTHVGHGREGTPEVLERLADDFGFTLTIVPTLRAGGEIISSSAIRRLLREGNVTQAATYLGRSHESTGPIVAGEARGRTLEIPTFNIVETDTLLPMEGVYATWSLIGSERFPSVTNVGVRPTFGGGGLVVETHLLSAAVPSSPRSLTIEWVFRIREERKFSSASALKQQISQDIESARNILDATKL